MLPKAPVINQLGNPDWHLQLLKNNTILADGVLRNRCCRSFTCQVSDRAENQEVLDSDQIEGLMSWNHNSGFNVHVGKPIDGADGEAIERLARYMSRAAFVS